MDYSEILEKAMGWGKENFPNSSIQHHAAFANSVAYLITGMSGGYGGPSLREHLVSWRSRGKRMSFDEAIAFATPLCFSPQSREALSPIWENESCFDDDPKDLKLLGFQLRR